MLWLEVKYDITWPPALLKRQTQYMVDTTGNEIVRGIKENIMLERSIYGAGLAPLRAATIERKRGMRYPSKPLYALGILYRAIHYFRTGENAGMVGITSIGRPNRRLVAYIQQFGLYRGGVARPFFGISTATRRRLDSMWRGWIEAIARRKDRYRSGTIRGGA